jgi:putative radical SAM enzyme (TIGR03279 family)
MKGHSMELKNLDDNRNIIEKIAKDSIADELGVESGDILISINGSKVKDIIDYKFLISDEYIEVDIEKANGEIWELEIEKEFDEDLGIEFTNPLIDKARSCRNKCIFCFIDQLPPNMRETLYFKDDDSRLSFLQGNFITLTNMTNEEIDRIIAYRLSPINISVHTTNPDLRVKMLNNKNAGKIFSILKKFKEANLIVNCQIVLVPGVNDGEELERTLKDLSSLYPSVKSVAVVPVGVTKYREKLHKLKPFNEEESKELLSLIAKEQGKFLKDMGTRFVFASDEFYAMTRKKLPSYEEYEGFPQLENGVGLMKAFEYEIDMELKSLKDNIHLNKKYIIATGTLAKDFMNGIINKIMGKIKGLELDIVPIENNFFGKTITVSGLITGQDIISNLEDYKDIDGIIIPKSMLRKSSDVFLDDLTIGDIENSLMVKIIPIEVSGKEFIDLFRKA